MTFRPEHYFQTRNERWEASRKQDITKYKEMVTVTEKKDKTLTYLHNCNSGDLVGALAGLREIFRAYGKKAVICQVLDFPGHYMPGLIHSVKNEAGVQVTFNRKMFDMMYPLLMTQEYIADFQIYGDQKIDIDLTIIRESEIVENPGDVLPKAVIKAKQFVNIPHMALPGWTMVAYPTMACDISKPWVSVPDGDDSISPYILVNRTERYQTGKIDYSFLKNHDNEVLFVGTEMEHGKFCKQFKLDFPRLKVDNFLDLAQAMKSCRFFLGNQSFPWNLANAMGVPRILEMCAYAPNCQPFVGQDNYGFLHQVPLEYYFQMLYNKTAIPKEQPVV